MALLLALLTFLVVAIVVGIIWTLAGGRDDRQDIVRRRMESVRKAESRSEVSLDLKLVRDELYSNVPLLHRILMSLPWSGWLQNYINQAGMKMKAGQFVLWTAVAGLGYLRVAQRCLPQSRIVVLVLRPGRAGCSIGLCRFRPHAPPREI